MIRETRPSTPQPVRRGQKRRLAKYFLPGQFLLHLTHPADVDRDEVEKRTIQFLLDKKAGEDWKDQIELPTPESIITLPADDKGGLAFSIIPTRLPGQRATDRDLLDLHKNLNARARGEPINVDPGRHIVLRAGSPNWLAGGANDQIGTGGPGSRPIEADTQAGLGWRFWLSSGQGVLSELPLADGRGSGVHVAILDTAPTLHALETAYAEWHWHHPIIDSMLREDGPMHVYPASYAELQHTRGYDLLRHRYIMRDHGLFVAGIIHTIAPQATLHLYEVLNPYGVGSLQSIALGLSKILKNAAIKRPLIINCSFVLSIPVKGTSDPDFPIPPELRDEETLQELSRSVQDFGDLLTSHKDVYVVAAAGNDSHFNNGNANGDRPPARYPAAFPKVWGVGALPKASAAGSGPYKAATYSNLSDMPVPGSYITFGGEPGPEQGVLGVYIGDFPVYKPSGFLGLVWRILTWRAAGQLPRLPLWIREEWVQYERNTTGWAWWAGTSFSTPVVSGILAANQGRPEILEDLYDQLRQGILNEPHPGQTNQLEKVIPVQQG